MRPFLAPVKIVLTFSAASLAIQLGMLSAREVVTEVAVSTDTFNQDETSIAVHPENDSLLLAVWNSEDPDYPDENMNVGFGFSTNGGLSWDTTGDIPELLQTVLIDAADPSCGFHDTLAFVCFIANDPDRPQGTGGAVYLARSSDFGQSWEHRLVNDGYLHVEENDTYGCDRPYMAVDNTGGMYDGNLYIAWADWYYPKPLTTELDSVAIRIATSSSQGDSFQYVVDLQKASRRRDDYPRGWLFSPVPTAGIDATVFASWVHWDMDYDIYYVKVAKSTDGGESFTTCETDSLTFTWSPLNDLDGFLRIGGYQTIACDGTNADILYLAYLNKESEQSDDVDLIFSKSTNKGETWSNPQVLIDGDNEVIFHPWLSASPDGILYLVYGRIPAGGGNMNIYVAMSLDQGDTFLTPHMRVNSVSSNPYPKRGPYGNDYQGIASTWGRAFPCWTDYRNEDVRNEDIYCAIVDVFRSGEVDTDETWSQLAVMTGDVTVPQGDTLSLEIESDTEKTTIYSIADFDDQAGGLDTSRCELIVEGSLHALGTGPSSVTLTSTEVDTLPAGWYGIRLKGGPDVLYYCEVQDAYIGVRSEGSISTLFNCSFLSNELSGVGSSPGSSLSISGSLFKWNGQYAIGLLRPLYAEIAMNDFYGNGDYGIYLTAGDDDGSDILISNNLIASESTDSSTHDYGIFVKLVNSGSSGPTHLEITDQNDVRDCLQAGIRIEAPANLTSLDSLSVIDHTTTTGNYNGIEIEGGRNLVLSWNDVTLNGNKGVFSSHHYPILGDVVTGKGRYNSIYDNGVYDVYVQTNIPNVPLKAQMNWWGDPGGPDPGKLFGNILYYPWLTMAP